MARLIVLAIAAASVQACTLFGVETSSTRTEYRDEQGDRRLQAIEQRLDRIDDRLQRLEQR